ncbi:MAG: hypothetical protein H0T79_19940 [Deltaproteobacteria bacterium]|nr:hypothetical protein [Deltaproteobacteria bacterium]
MRGTTRRITEAGGLQRSYLVYLPAGDPRTPMPMVIVAHGFSMSGQLMFDITEYKALADREHIALAFPDGQAGPNSSGAPWNVALGWDASARGLHRRSQAHHHVPRDLGSDHPDRLHRSRGDAGLGCRAGGHGVGSPQRLRHDHDDQLDREWHVRGVHRLSGRWSGDAVYARRDGALLGGWRGEHRTVCMPRVPHRDRAHLGVLQAARLGLITTRRRARPSCHRRSAPRSTPPTAPSSTPTAASCTCWRCRRGTRSRTTGARSSSSCSARGSRPRRRSPRTHRCD